MFRWRDRGPGIDLAFTSRAGGVSGGAWASLNLGGHVGDDPAAVAANRASVAAGLGLDPDRVVFMDQQHGADVAVVDGRTVAGRDARAPLAVDAMVTTEVDLALGVLVADCVPVLLHDAARGVVGVAHAGRPGFLAGVVDRVVATMREAGATRLAATVGPSVCGRCYEVPAELRDAAAVAVPESAARSWTGTAAIDVATGVVAQLRAGGVDVTWLPGCTREDGDLFSYRRDGVTGRTAGLVVRRAA